VIVVIGRPAIVPTGDGDGGSPGGLAVRVATAIADAGEPVELVGSIGDDADGDRIAVALGQAGVGHAALLRDPAARTPHRDPAARTPHHSAADRSEDTSEPLPRLDADDVSLGLRYLPGCRVLVIADALDARARAAAIDGAAYHGASVIAVVASAEEVNDGFAGAIVLIAPDPTDDDAAPPAAFEAFVAGCAVRIARGTPPEVALAEAATARSWEPSDG
jgi:hypothetical protein